MAWEANSNVASEMVERGYTVITCPWNLGVPWEEWNMHVCNASRLKKSDSVLGATLVAWEQPPLTHITNLRNLASRQERTWGPDNSVTLEGFASRFQPLDAMLGRLIEMPAKSLVDAAFVSTAGVDGYLDPVFATDGRDDTFFRTATPPKAGDHFTVTLPQARSVHSIEVRTGINHRGLFDGGEVQVSHDGRTFATVTTLKSGVGKGVLKDNRVRAIRIRTATDQKNAMVVRAINLSMMAALSGKIGNPASKVGDGNVAVIAADVEFAYPIGTFTHPIINRGFTLRINNGGNPCNISGPITGTGRVEIHAPGVNAPLTLDGKAANTLDGTWTIASGRVVLAKPPGVDAMSRRIEVGADSTLLWNASHQLPDSAEVQATGTLNLNGHDEKIARLSLSGQGKILTSGPPSGGVFAVRELVVNGKPIRRGVYSSNNWVQGTGYAVVGDVQHVEISGSVDSPVRTIGIGNIAKLKASTSIRLSKGTASFTVVLNGQRLTLADSASSRFEGFIAGDGQLVIDSAADQPFEFGGLASNTFKGPTTVYGVLNLNKRGGAVAIPGNLLVGDNKSQRRGNGIVWQGDGQIATSANVSLIGTQPCFLDLNGHKAEFGKLQLSKSAFVRTGEGGRLRLKQLHLDGRRLKDGEYRAPQAWLRGTGSVVVDARVNVQGIIGSPEAIIGVGNIGNLTGLTKISYPSSGGDFDIATNGHTLKLDSGDGNAFAFSGAISGTGDVEFYMGPSYTGFRDAPMIIGGTKANSTSGKFLVKKGRVQLEKPEGVDAISGDVVVGGQGFNDCLYWKNSHQLKDTVNITLIDAGNSGAAYLHLNGCTEKAASLTMTANNKVLTDSASGAKGMLTVRALTVAGRAMAAGTYTSATEKWIEGGGRVVVAK